MSDYQRWGPYNNGMPAQTGELRGSAADLGAPALASLLIVIVLGAGWCYQVLTVSVGLPHLAAVVLTAAAGITIASLWKFIWFAACFVAVSVVLGWSVIMITRAMVETWN